MLRRCTILLLMTAFFPFTQLSAQTPKEQATTAKFDQDAYRQMVKAGIEYLKTVQREDGSFTDVPSPGVTTLVTTAMLRQGVSADDPTVKKGLAFVEKLIQEDGGIYQPDSFHKNYETCLAIMCLVEANKDGRYDEIIKGADHFIKGLQWDEDEGISKEDFAYGGAGYGSHKRPDLSNTSYMIDALRAAGNDANEEHIQAALAFVSRTQNLESEHNTTPFAAKINDGSIYYTPAAGGASQSEVLPNGGLRGYGSMTYAGLKSFIFAGVSKDDPRVVAALDWLSKNFTLEHNPGMPEHLRAAGLYYYYHTFAKALNALGEDEFVDAAGEKHNWRAELVNELSKRQQKNGSWINTENEKWLENDGALVTGYALLALSYCEPESK
jgi:squalene-hopene/tetraprenyl-beta-curcumene cyclase